MKLDISRYSIKIIPEDNTISGFGQQDERDTAFIEEVLGLRKDGDSVRLIRKNAHGLLCIAYLETEKQFESDKMQEEKNG